MNDRKHGRYAAVRPLHAPVVELPDFSVFCAQDSIAAAEAALSANRKGGSRIVVEQGQVVKVSRNTDGTVSREALTRHWTGDYVFENEWQSFRTRKDRSLELISVAHE